MSKTIDLTSKKFGMLTVIGKAGHNRHGQLMWECICDCGNKTIVIGQNLRRGMTKSCGCSSHLPKTKTHGMTGTVLHNKWLNMKSRCYNPNNKRYNRYGGRGIKVCEEWEKDFMSFYNWAMKNGFKESLTIDRIDNDGDYCPENCRFSTPKEQANNRSKNKLYEIKGKTKTLSDWCSEYGIEYNTVAFRLKKGVDIENALSKNYKRKSPERNKYLEELERKSLEKGLKYHTVYSRIFVRGWSEEKALNTPVNKNK